ncbi:hypothetical protein B0O80DRAFT_440003 [Mortierella sp. GBAus27b]|nr:hypothetical protein B0O80DRAFT_440003 [Mortierella sp. GBAus27b]
MDTYHTRSPPLFPALLLALQFVSDHRSPLLNNVFLVLMCTHTHTHAPPMAAQPTSDRGLALLQRSLWLQHH